MKIMLSAGEASGDLNASFLAAELKKIHPGIELFGMGGAKMSEQGVRLLEDPTSQGILGFSEAIKALPKMKKLLAKLTAALQEEKPDCLVLVDFPGFNMKLAEQARGLGIPVVYYFAPSAWAWGRGRAKKVAETVDLVLSVFPMEEAVYREAGANVLYLGHPLAERVRSRDNPRELLGIEPNVPIVALLPGSRPAEIKSLMKEMLAAAQLVREKIPAVQFVVSQASSISREALSEQIDQLPFPVQILSGSTYELLAAADAAVIASGTATLEAALLGTPMVIVYRTSRLTWILGKLLLKIPFVGLPNILAGEELVPELLQDEAKGVRIAQELLRLLSEDQCQLRKRLLGLREKLGEDGVARRAAEAILELAVGRGRGAHSPHSK